VCCEGGSYATSTFHFSTKVNIHMLWRFNVHNINKNNQMTRRRDEMAQKDKKKDYYKIV
jgi:hypothetical protein